MGFSWPEYWSELPFPPPEKVRLVKAMVFPIVMYGDWDHKEGWAPKNWCFQTVVLEKTLESPLDFKEIKPVSSKGNQSWIFIERTDAEAKATMLCKEPALWKRTWCWERLRAKEEGGNRGWDGWMASLTQRTWVWANSRREWRTGQPGLLQYMGLQRVRHNLETEQQHSWFTVC